MAYRVPNINPVDVGGRVAIGVSIPFNNAAIFNQTYSTTTQVRSNIINYVLTRKGERVLNPDFGLGLEQYLFDDINSTTLNSIQNLITNDLTSLFPTITLQSVTATPDYDNNAINIKIRYYTIEGNTDEINVSI
jgi:phage baseplate assembly protein W